MESLTLGFGAALLMGLAFGAGPCNVSCLPYLGPVFLAQERLGAWRTVLPFSFGRLVSYSTLGAVAGGLGHMATSWLEDGWAAMLLGTATVFVGLVLWYRAGRNTRCPAKRASNNEQQLHFYTRSGRRPLGMGLFGMGAAMALNPCVPLGTVLVAAAAGASAVQGVWLGFGFGVGAVLIPSIVFGVVMAHFGAQIRSHLAGWHKNIERGAAMMLMVLGMVTAAGWVQP
ncbi:MAG: sulfite exporter TauE/SafE family protein [Pseudomonadota bacterium]